MEIAIQDGASKVRAHAAEMICTLAASGLLERCGDVPTSRKLLLAACADFRQLSESAQLSPQLNHVGMTSHADPRPLERACVALGGTVVATSAIGSPGGDRIDVGSMPLDLAAAEAVERAGVEGFENSDQGALQREAIGSAQVTGGVGAIGTRDGPPPSTAGSGALGTTDDEEAVNREAVNLDAEVHLVGEPPIEIAHKIILNCGDLRQAASLFHLNRSFEF